MVSFRAPLQSLLAPTLGLALAAASLPCAAQLRLDVVPESALPPSQRSVGGASALSVPATTTRAFSGSASSSWIGSAIQLEEPRATGTGQYTRPKFHVGVPSESMRGFLNSAGFSAEKCQLPMVRARTKSSGDGDINGTLWLYARCTFR